MGLAALKLKTEPTPLQRARTGRGNRTPAEVRQAEGTKARPQDNGGSVVDRTHDVPALGGAPSRWPADLKAIWRSLADEVPWLRKPDRKAVIEFCRLWREHENAWQVYDGGTEDEKEKASAWKRWMETGKEVRTMMQRLGLTPADRTRVSTAWK